MKKIVLFLSLICAQFAIASPTIINYKPSHHDQVLKILYEDPFLIFPGEELIKSGKIAMDEFYERTQALFNRNLKSSDWVHKVLLVDDKVCGFASYMIQQDETYLGLLAITKKSRGQGLGTLLMNNVIEEVNKLSSKTIWLEVNKSNLRAQKFYKKNGFYASGFSQELNLVYYTKYMTLRNKLLSWKKLLFFGTGLFVTYLGYTYFAKRCLNSA